MTTAQRFDGDDLRFLAELAQKEGWSRTKFATFAGISPKGADYLFLSEDELAETI